MFAAIQCVRIDSKKNADAAEETEAHAELRRVDADTRAVSELIAVVGDVDDVESRLDPFFAVELKRLLYPEAHRVIRWDTPAVWNHCSIGGGPVRPQAAAIKRVGINPSAAP